MKLKGDVRVEWDESNGDEESQRFSAHWRYFKEEKYTVEKKSAQGRPEKCVDYLSSFKNYGC